MKKKEAANKRIIVSYKFLFYDELFERIQEKYIPEGWPVTSEIQTAPACDEATTVLTGAEAKLKGLNTSLGKDLLGIKYTDIQTSVAEMVEKMIANGQLVKPEFKAQSMK